MSAKVFNLFLGLFLGLLFIGCFSELIPAHATLNAEKVQADPDQDGCEHGRGNGRAPMRIPQLQLKPKEGPEHESPQNIGTEIRTSQRTLRGVGQIKRVNISHKDQDRNDPDRG